MNTMQKMKKAIITGPKKIEVVEVDTPKPGKDEVLVKVLSIGICGSDLHYYAGDQIGERSIVYPMSLGHEFAGDIVEVGPGVCGMKPGDRIMAEPALGCGECEWCKGGRSNLCPESRFCGSPPVDGAFSQYYVLNKHQALPIWDDMTYDDALMAEPLANLLHVMDLANLKKGMTACVLGCGPIGLLLLQLVRLKGAARIFASEKVEYRRELATRLGADAAYDANACDAAEEILKATDGRGVDVAFEAAGDPPAIAQCIRAAKRAGTVVIEGIPAATTITLDIRTARRKELLIQFCRRCPETPARALKLIHGRKLDVKSLVTHHFPIGRIGEAFSVVYAHADNAVKVVINPW